MSHELDPSSIEVADDDPLPDLGGLHNIGNPIVLNERFRIDEQLAATPDSFVYRAIDKEAKESQRVAAIKVFREENPESFHRHTVEIALCENMSHPNIIGSLGAGAFKLAEEEFRYMAMPFASEGTLARFYQQRELIDDEGVVLPIIHDVTDGLSEIHEQGLVHRDIHPRNILINKNGRLSATIADLGVIAPSESLQEVPILETPAMKALEAVMQAERKSSYPSNGTYTAPEQEKGECSTSASDVYSAGRIILRIVGVGNYADRGYFIDELGSVHPHLTPDQIPTRAWVPKELSRAISHTQEVDPKNRPSAKEMAEIAAKSI